MVVGALGLHAVALGSNRVETSIWFGFVSCCPGLCKKPTYYLLPVWVLLFLWGGGGGGGGERGS